MLEKYKDMQTIFYNFINLSFKNNRISHAYLIETNGVSYADDLVLDLSKFFLCDGKLNNSIISQIDKGIYDNFKIIDVEKEIRKEDILGLQQDFSFKSVNNGKMVCLIKNVDRLNKYAANRLLKFLEDPEDDIIAILTVNNIGDVLGTVVSRCQLLSLVNNEEFDCSNIFKSFYDETEDFDAFFERNFEMFISFYYNYEIKGVSILSDDNIYLFNDKMRYLLEFGLYLYFDVLNYMLGYKERKYIECEDFILKSTGNNKINDIIRKIDIINRFIYNSKFNVNKNLFMDNFIISMGG